MCVSGVGVAPRPPAHLPSLTRQCYRPSPQNRTHTLFGLTGRGRRLAKTDCLRARTRRDGPPAAGARDFFKVSMTSILLRTPVVVIWVESNMCCTPPVHAIPSWVRLGFVDVYAAVTSATTALRTPLTAPATRAANICR